MIINYNCVQNRYMFTYLSVLVEMQVLSQVEIHFLIVGHTHTTIDQYFSALNSGIDQTCFVGTPLAMRYLLEHVHGIQSRRPVVAVAIEVKSYKTFALKLIKFLYIGCVRLRRST